MLGTDIESFVSNTTRKRGHPYGRVCVAFVSKGTLVTKSDFVHDSGFSVAVVNITSIGDALNHGVIPVYKGGTHALEVRGTSLDQGQIWFSLQPYTSHCNGTLLAATRKRAVSAPVEAHHRAWQEPMRLWPTYTDPSHLALLHFRSQYQTSQASLSLEPYRLCVAMLGSYRTQWYWSDFNLGTSPFDMHVAVVELRRIQHESNRTIAVLRYSTPTLTVVGRSMGYGPSTSHCSTT